MKNLIKITALILPIFMAAQENMSKKESHLYYANKIFLVRNPESENTDLCQKEICILNAHYFSEVLELTYHIGEDGMPYRKFTWVPVEHILKYHSFFDRVNRVYVVSEHKLN